MIRSHEQEGKQEFNSDRQERTFSLRYHVIWNEANNTLDWWCL